MIHEHSYDGLIVRTGDIICTRDGVEGSLFGQIWRLFGRLVPGEIDHCLIYIGPGGRCVESALKGVVLYAMPGNRWDANSLAKDRLFVDTLIGVAYPLENRGLSLEEERVIREGVAAFCLQKAEQRKPYNINFINPDTDRAYYCSQLVYKAYLSQGINLNTNQGVPSGLVLDRMVFPEEIWNSSPHRRIGDQSLSIPGMGE